MPKFEHIAVPTDLSKESTIVFAHAVKFALGSGAHLKLIHVHPGEPQEVPWFNLPTVHDMMDDWKLLPPDATVQDYDELGLHIRADHWVAADPTDGAVEALEREPPDLLIVGTSRRTGLARLLKGSVAEAIARRTRLHTLFIGSDTRGFVKPETGECVLARVLVPVGPEINLKTVLRVVDRFLAGLTPAVVQITLLTVNDHIDLEVGDTVDHSHLRFRVERRDGDVVAKILEVAEEMRAQLICMPTQDRDSFSDVLLGTRTEQVLQSALCPVLTLRDRS